MAVSTAVLTDSGDAIDRSSYNTASVSPSADKLIRVWVSAQTAGGAAPTIPTLSGNGITWTLIDSAADTNAFMQAVFRGSSASPSSGAITIDFAGNTQANCRWTVLESDGVDLAQGDQGVIQSNSGQSSGTAMTAPLAAFANPGNAVECGGVVAAFGPPSITDEAGYTALTTSTSGQLRQAVSFLASEDTSPTMTRSSTGEWGMIAMEIAAAGTGPTNHTGALALAVTGALGVTAQLGAGATLGLSATGSLALGAGAALSGALSLPATAGLSMSESGGGGGAGGTGGPPGEAPLIPPTLSPLPLPIPMSVVVALLWASL